MQSILQCSSHLQSRLDSRTSRDYLRSNGDWSNPCKCKRQRRIGMLGWWERKGEICGMVWCIHPKLWDDPVKPTNSGNTIRVSGLANFASILQFEFLSNKRRLIRRQARSIQTLITEGRPANCRKHWNFSFVLICVVAVIQDNSGGSTDFSDRNKCCRIWSKQSYCESYRKGFHGYGQWQSSKWIRWRAPSWLNEEGRRSRRDFFDMRYDSSWYMVQNIGNQESRKKNIQI